MLAPIALYPYPLLGQILMAATYPLEIVHADRWLKDPRNGALKGEGLSAVLANLPWDPNVKSLAAFPQIIRMMNGDLDWTERLRGRGEWPYPIPLVRQGAGWRSYVKAGEEQIITADRP